MSRSKAPLAYVWHEERFYTVGPVPQNGTSELADGKPWVSMPFNWNEFTIMTRVTFLAFGLSIKRTFDTANQLATRIICMKRALNYG